MPGKLITVDQFSVTKRHGFLTEQILDFFCVQLHLLPEFPQGKQNSKGVVVGFIEELNTSRIGKAFKAIQGIGPVSLHLLEYDARKGKGDPKIAVVLIYQVP